MEMIRWSSSAHHDNGAIDVAELGDAVGDEILRCRGGHHRVNARVIEGSFDREVAALYRLATSSAADSIGSYTQASAAGDGHRSSRRVRVRSCRAKEGEADQRALCSS